MKITKKEYDFFCEHWAKRKLYKYKRNRILNDILEILKLTKSGYDLLNDNKNISKRQTGKNVKIGEIKCNIYN